MGPPAFAAGPYAAKLRRVAHTIPFSLGWCGRPGGLLDFREVGGTGFLGDRLLVFGAHSGPAVEALAQHVGVPGMPDGLAEEECTRMANRFVLG